MPMPRWWWVCNAEPVARVSALALPAEEQPEVVLPGEHEPVGFVAHIRPLFRAAGRAAMRFAFDLWSRPEVAEHAGPILARLRAGRASPPKKWRSSPAGWTPTCPNDPHQGPAAATAPPHRHHRGCVVTIERWH
jgi:hypothetical protein